MKGSILKGSIPLPKVFVILTQAFVLAACGAEHPKVELGALAARSTINVTTRISDTRKVTSAAYTRSEGAVAGAAGGASGALEGAITTADPWALPLAILLLPVFATVGGATGAASGTSHSREEIIMALTTVNQAYVPHKFERNAERHITVNLERNLFGKKGPCFSTRQTRSKCPQITSTSKLNISMAFNLVPARSGSGAGNVDYLGKITLDAQPDGVLRPECVSFIFRQFAGNIFDLAKNDGAELN